MTSDFGGHDLPAPSLPAPLCTTMGNEIQKGPHSVNVMANLFNPN